VGSHWWLNDDLLLETAQKRQQVLAALSPAMKEDVKRFLELSLVDRVRGVLTRSLAAHRFRSVGTGSSLGSNRRVVTPSNSASRTTASSCRPPPK
jgi:hypothetical protein